MFTSSPNVHEDYVCSLNHTMCGPGPVIGFGSTHTQAVIPQPTLTRNVSPIGRRNLIGIILAAVFITAGLTLYAAFGKWPRRKLRGCQRMRRSRNFATNQTDMESGCVSRANQNTDSSHTPGEQEKECNGMLPTRKEDINDIQAYLASFQQHRG